MKSAEPASGPMSAYVYGCQPFPSTAVVGARGSLFPFENPSAFKLGDRPTVTWRHAERERRAQRERGSIGEVA